MAASTLDEALRTTDPQLRSKLLHAISRPSWLRLMPEVYEEAREFVHEVRRLRPAWLRSSPDRQQFQRLQRDWQRQDKRGRWGRAVHDSERERERLVALEDGVIDRARVQARQRRRQAQHEGRRYEEVAKSALHDDLGWRVAASFSVGSMLNLVVIPNAFFEWLGDEVDIQASQASVSSWKRFWLSDVTAQHMPRFWLRWAFETLQSVRRVTDGTPCDAQLGTYLAAADLFITADRAFAEITRGIRSVAPVPVADVQCVVGGTDAVAATVAAIRQWRRPPHRS